MKERTAVLIGHRDCFGLEEAAVTEALKQLIALGVTDFLCGGQGLKGILQLLLSGFDFPHPPFC